ESVHAVPPDVAPVSGTGLAYTDPAAAGWRLMKNAASTPQRLVLDLVGPAELKTRGAAINLIAPAGIHFLRFPETTMPVKDLGVYELYNTQPKNGVRSPPEPALAMAAVKAGTLLTAGVFQKDRRAGAKASGCRRRGWPSPARRYPGRRFAPPSSSPPSAHSSASPRATDSPCVPPRSARRGTRSSTSIRPSTATASGAGGPSPTWTPPAPSG